MGLLEEQIRERQKKSATGKSLLQQKLEDRRKKERAGSTVPTTGRVADNRSFLERHLSEEIGGVSNFIGFFQQGQAQDILTEDLQRQQGLLNLFKTTTNPEVKNKLRRQLAEEIDKRSIGEDIFGELVPSTKKSNSQAFFEMVSFGALAAPIPGASLAVKPGVKLATKFALGAAGGSVTGAVLGLAQEGEIKDKLPEIALMTGFGAVGGSILIGALPAATVAIKSGVKKIIDKVNAGRLAGTSDTNVILPVIRTEVEKATDILTPVKPKPVKGLTKTQKDVIETEAKLTKANERLDNFLIDDTAFITRNTGVQGPTPEAISLVTRLKDEIAKGQVKLNQLKKIALRSPTPENKFTAKAQVTFMSELSARLKTTERTVREAGKTSAASLKQKIKEEDVKRQANIVAQLQKDVKRLQKEETKLGDKSILKNFELGDRVFSPSTGRFDLIQFFKDIDTGRTMALGIDFNGRPTTITAADLAKMSKVTQTQEQTLIKFDNLPEVEGRVELGPGRKFQAGLHKYIKTVSEVLKGMGRPGKQLAKLFDASETSSRILFSDEMEPMRLFFIRNKIKRLGDKQIKNIVDILDTGLRKGISDINQILKTVKPIDDTVEEFVKIFSKTTQGLVNRGDALRILVKNQ